MVRKSHTPRLSPSALETSVLGTFSCIISIFEEGYDLSPMRNLLRLDWWLRREESYEELEKKIFKLIKEILIRLLN